MAGQSSSPRWRLGVVGVLLGGLIGSTLIWQTISEAGAVPFSPRVLAAFADKNLQVAVALPAAEKSVTGKVSVDLLDAAGKTLASHESKLSKFDASVDLSFTFADIKKADADKFKLRVKFKNKQAEMPLAKALLGKGGSNASSATA
jgi:hypothetical protein